MSVTFDASYMRSQAMPKARPFAPDYLWRRKPVREDDEKGTALFCFFMFTIYKLSIDFGLQSFMMEENGTRLKEAATWRT
ncbi:MAG: hypothetical protein ACLU3D_08285 [Acutalibacteraceae bacterium]